MLSSASLANDQSTQWGVTNSALRQTYLKAINLLSLIFKIFVIIEVVNFSVAPHSSMSCLCYTCSFLVFPLKKCTSLANDQSAQGGMTNSALRQTDMQAFKLIRVLLNKKQKKTRKNNKTKQKNKKKSLSKTPMPGCKSWR